MSEQGKLTVPELGDFEDVEVIETVFGSEGEAQENADSSDYVDGDHDGDLVADGSGGGRAAKDLTTHHAGQRDDPDGSGFGK